MPTLLELIELHLEEMNFDVIAWRGQAANAGDAPVWLTCTTLNGLAFIHIKDESKVAVSTDIVTLAILDPADPLMFDQLDAILTSKRHINKEIETRHSLIAKGK